MVSGILAVLGICFVQVSYQMNLQQARALSQIQNISQLFETAIINFGGRRVGVREVLPNLGSSGEQMYVGPGLGELAMPDECSPRLTTVEIPRVDIDDVNVLLWPTCTRVARCGGCCANNMLKCIPKSVRPKPVTILKAKLWDSNEPDLMMDWEGAMQVDIMEHSECEIVCRITAEDCNRRQRYDEFDCSCRCRRPRICRPTQRWDMESCTCVCKDRTECPDGGFFNPRSCRCQISRDRTYSSLDGEYLEGDQTQSDNATISNDNSTAVPTTTVPTTTTPTTTTTTTTTPEPEMDSVCDQPIFCPPGFMMNLDSDGDCVCTPPNFPFSFK